MYPLYLQDELKTDVIQGSLERKELEEEDQGYK